MLLTVNACGLLVKPTVVTAKAAPEGVTLIAALPPPPPVAAPVTMAVKVTKRGVSPISFEVILSWAIFAPGVVVPLDSPYMSAASAAIEAGFGRAPVFGNVTRKQVRSPCRVQAIEPPCSSATSRATDKPSPTPSRFCETNGSNSDSRIDSEGPAPESEIVSE